MPDKKSKKDDKKTTEKKDGVVKVRKVISVPLSLKDALVGEPQDPAKENPDAPKPIPNQTFKPRVVQIRRRHERPHEQKPPSGMSDIKI